jgi:hypothetical protein
MEPQIFGHPPHSLFTIPTTQSQIQHRVVEIQLVVFWYFCTSALDDDVMFDITDFGNL